MFRGKKAQSVVEYAAAIALIILAMVLVGKQVSDQFTGGIKNLTQKDEEIFRQAPSDPGTQLPHCDCPFPETSFCHHPVNNPSPCVTGQRYYFRNCTGSACTTNRIERCEWDNSCCSDTWPDPAPVTHCWSGPTGSQCLPEGYGFGRRCKQCGNPGVNPPTCGCEDDPRYCHFTCGFDHLPNPPTPVGPARTNNSSICPGDTIQPYPNALPWVRVADGVGNCTARKCEEYCDSANGWVFDPGTGQCIEVRCGDGIMTPGFEACDPGPPLPIPLIDTSFGSGGSGPRLQKQACLDNCRTVGYRYYMRNRNHNATLSNPAWHPPLGYTSYISHSGSQDTLYITCTNGKVVRLHETAPVELMWGGFDANMCEGADGMWCQNSQWVINGCNIAWGQCGYDNSAEGSPTCRIQCWYSGKNHATWGFVCEDPPPMNCWAIPYHIGWKNTVHEPVCSGAIAYAGMNLEGSYQMMDYCEGNCDGNDVWVKWCCRNSSTPNLSGANACIALRQNVPIPANPPPFPNCPFNYTKWFEWNTRDSQTTYCCPSAITMPTCRAVYKNDGFQPIPTCAANEKQLAGFKDPFAQGYTRFCCSSFP